MKKTAPLIYDTASLFLYNSEANCNEPVVVVGKTCKPMIIIFTGPGWNDKLYLPYYKIRLINPFGT